MKESRYNLIVDSVEGKKLAFNSNTCSLAEVDDHYFDILKKVKSNNLLNLSNEEEELLENLKLGGYVIEDDVDELKVMKYKNYFGKYNKSTLGLTIAPTLLCNFRCVYCYETPKASLMTEDIRDAIVKYVEESAKSINELSVTWYGGEPLMRKDIIEELSEKFMDICNENNIKYSAFIITNGYLLDEDTIELFKKYKINGAQITIDGPPEVQNKRRVLLSGNNDGFDKTFNALKLLKKHNIYISFRVNVDRDNIQHIDDLLDILDENNIKIPIGFGQVTPYTDICKSVTDICYGNEEYSDIMLYLHKKLNNRGFKVMGHPYYPGNKMNYCCADHISSFVIDPDGFMYKCWNEVGNIDQSVGNIKDYNDNKYENAMINRTVEYMTWSPFEHKECIECDILPICMGGCPYTGIKESKPSCEKWKYNLKEVLMYTHNDYYDDTEKYEKVLVE